MKYHTIVQFAAIGTLRKQLIKWPAQARNDKAELQQEGIFFLLQLFARDVLVMKKLEMETTKPSFIISVLTVE